MSNLEEWMQFHGFTREELKQCRCITEASKIKFPIQTGSGIKYHTRLFSGKSKFINDDGLKAGTYFYTPITPIGSSKLIICAGPSDCINAYLAFNREVDCIGVLGEGVIPSNLLTLKYNEYIIAFDNDEAGKNGAIKLANKLKGKVSIVDWSLFSDTNDLSELSSQYGRDKIVELVSTANVLPQMQYAESDIYDAFRESLDVKRFLPPQMADCLIEEAKSKQTCPEYLLTLMLPAVTSLLGDTSLIAFQSSGYIVPPNLFAGILVETGSNKTSIINSITNPLQEMQIKEEEIYQSSLKEYELLNQEEQEKPALISYFTTDPSRESVAALKNKTGGHLLKYGEFEGFFRSINKLRNGKGDDLQFWINVHDGSADIVQRVKERRSNYGMRISIVGAGHVDKTIQAMKSESKENMENDSRGLGARFIFCAKKVSLPKLIKIPRRLNFQEELKKLYEFLQRRPWGRLDEKRFSFQLTEEAQDLLSKFREKINELIVNAPTAAIKALYPKVESNALRICQALHAIWSYETKNHLPEEIEKEILELAIDLALYFSRQSVAVYQYNSRENRETVDQLLKLTEFIKRKPEGVTVREIQAGIWMFREASSEDIKNQYLAPLIDKKVIQKEGNKYSYFNADVDAELMNASAGSKPCASKGKGQSADVLMQIDENQNEAAQSQEIENKEEKNIEDSRRANIESETNLCAIEKTSAHQQNSYNHCQPTYVTAEVSLSKLSAHQQNSGLKELILTCLNKHGALLDTQICQRLKIFDIGDIQSELRTLCKESQIVFKEGRYSVTKEAKETFLANKKAEVKQTKLL